MNNKKNDSSPQNASIQPSQPKNPFAYKAFAVLWIATVLSNIGTWMHDVGAGWLMTSLSNSSPTWVSLTQAATALPVFLLALPSGALADILNRKHMLLAVQSTLVFVALGLGITVALGITTPLLLLVFTFFMGVGAAITSPVWQAIVPSLVSRPALQQAVAINSVGVNISRAIGPVLAVIIIGAAGSAAPFFVNALSYVVVVVALLWWRPPAAPEHHLPPEQLPGAIQAGLRYAFHSDLLKAPLIKAAGFFIFASAYWALLPLIAREVLQGSVNLYGILLGCIGVGAVCAAFLLPVLRKKLTPDNLLVVGTVGTVLTMCVFALVKHTYVVGAFCFIAGASWIIVLTSLNTAVQISLPDWVRARGLSIFVMVFFGSQTLGSITWGQVASHTSIPVALLIASAGAIFAMFLTYRFKLPQDDSANLSPSMHWPSPLVNTDIEIDRGPVLVTIEYQIDPAQAAPFVSTMYQLHKERLRDGAYAWGIFEDTTQSGRYLEYFIVASWAEHLRQHERVTEHDRDIQAAALNYHIGKEPPAVTHFLAPDISASEATPKIN